MKWLRKALIVFSGSLPSVRFARGLQADEQVQILDRAQNPIRPLDEFPEALTRGRKTLILGDTELPEKWLDYLKSHNHQVTKATDLETLVQNGAYQYDSIIVMDADQLVKRHVTRLIKFYDTRWFLPAAYDDSRMVEMRGLRLPPSLLLLDKLPTNFTLHEFGLELIDDVGERGVVISNPFRVTDAFINSSLNFGNSTLHPLVKSPFAQPVLSWSRDRWIGAAIHGDVSWSRALILPDAIKICSDRALQDCLELFDWAFHKSAVTTWANLQHRRLKSGREFDEFDGTQRVKPYTKSELVEMAFETVDTYRIRDELLLSFDLYALHGDGIQTPYHWATPAKNEVPDLYGSFEMMVPYWRKPLTVYNRVLNASRSDATKESFFIRALQEHGAVDALTLKKDLSILAHIKAPRQHGVYKFVVRPVTETLVGPLWIETLVPLRTYLHDAEEPRGIWSAFPFYLSIGVMALAPLYVLQGSF